MSSKLQYWLLSLATFFITESSQAQYQYAHSYFEAGLTVGVMNYSGELTNSIMDFKHMHLGAGVFGRYNMNPFISFRLQASLGSVSGDDRDSRETRNQIRNLHFRSHMFEGALLAECNLMGYNPGRERHFSPYIFFGVGVYNYNPKARHFDIDQTDAKGDPLWVELQPLNTEGQGHPDINLEPYNLTQISIPLGFGFKYAVHSNLNIGIEVGFRKTFTDYLDDVSNTYRYDLYDTEGYVGLDGTDFGGYSAQHLMADRTYEYIAEQNGEVLGHDYFPSQEDYEEAVALRSESIRGDRAQDWYVFTSIFVSYNFLDNGLVGARKRRKRRAGCKSARF